MRRNTSHATGFHLISPAASVVAAGAVLDPGLMISGEAEAKRGTGKNCTNFYLFSRGGTGSDILGK